MVCGVGGVLWNTFRRAWRPDDIQRHAWEGLVLCIWKRTVIDYIMVDQFIAMGGSPVLRLRASGFASDHYGINGEFKLR